jgi:hypothetical protein
MCEPQVIGWRFGAGFKAIRQMKPVYPEAQVDVEGQGLALHPSAPAVPKAEAKRLGIA